MFEIQWNIASDAKSSKVTALFSFVVEIVLVRVAGIYILFDSIVVPSLVVLNVLHEMQ